MTTTMTMTTTTTNSGYKMSKGCSNINNNNNSINNSNKSINNPWSDGKDEADQSSSVVLWCNGRCRRR
jgi:hypothetical protein